MFQLVIHIIWKKETLFYSLNMLKNIRCYSVNVMHFDLSHLEPPRQRSEMHFFLNISTDMPNRSLLCVTDIQEITCICFHFMPWPWTFSKVKCQIGIFVICPIFRQQTFHILEIRTTVVTVTSSKQVNKQVNKQKKTDKSKNL